MTLTEFLIARLDEDEAVARAAAVRPLRGRGRYGPLGTVYDRPPEQKDVDAIGVVWYRHDDGWSGSDTGSFPAGLAHFERFDPARVLADVAAKRGILELHPTSEYRAYWVKDAPTTYRCFCQEEDGVIQGVEPCDTKRLLAQPYHAHPDFDPAWKVNL